MSKLDTVALRGRSGETYKFNVYPMDTNFNAVGAVYVVSRRSKNQEVKKYQYRILYVGETGDLSTRFDDHHKADCFAQNKANCICVHRDDDQVYRLFIENDLTKLWNPPCND